MSLHPRGWWEWGYLLSAASGKSLESQKQLPRRMQAPCIATGCLGCVVPPGRVAPGRLLVPPPTGGMPAPVRPSGRRPGLVRGHVEKRFWQTGSTGQGCIAVCGSGSLVSPQTHILRTHWPLGMLLQCLLMQCAVVWSGGGDTLDGLGPVGGRCC